MLFCICFARYSNRRDPCRLTLSENANNSKFQTNNDFNKTSHKISIVFKCGDGRHRNGINDNRAT